MADDKQKDAAEQEEPVATQEATAAPEQAPEAPAQDAVEPVAAPEEATPEVAEAVADAEPEKVVEEAPVEEAPAAEVAEPVEEAKETPTESTDAEAPGEVAEEAAPAKEAPAASEQRVVVPEGMIGFTGELTGKVYSIEDLDQVTDPEDANIGLDDLRKLVENTLTNVSEHEIVSGKVVSISDKDVVIDIGFKSDGIVSRSEFDSELEAGAEVEVYLERIEDYHGQLVLSKTKADTVRRWRRIEDAFDNEEILNLHLSKLIFPDQE